MELDGANNSSVCKVFVDAACFPDGTTCWGIIILNQDDTPRLCACKKDSIQVDPVVDEAMGLRWSIQAAIENRVTDVVFLTDAQVVTVVMPFVGNVPRFI